MRIEGMQDERTDSSRHNRVCPESLTETLPAPPSVAGSHRDGRLSHTGADRRETRPTFVSDASCCGSLFRALIRAWLSATGRKEEELFIFSQRRRCVLLAATSVAVRYPIAASSVLAGLRRSCHQSAGRKRDRRLAFLVGAERLLL